jgi:hypothetical protein
MNKKQVLPPPVQWERRVSFKNGIPWILRQKINIEGKKFVLINEISKIPTSERKNYILLFYTNDKDFNAYYTDMSPKRLEILQSFYAIISLDFSTYSSADYDDNKVAIKKNRRFCTFCQYHDILCIYNIVWASNADYDLAFSHVEKGAVIALSTYRISNHDDNLFRKGYLSIKRKIKPSIILCYGNPQACMEKDIKSGLVVCIPTRFKILKQELFEKTGQCSFLNLLKIA